MTTSIRNSCVLVKVSIGKQSAYVTDKEITDKVESQYSTHGRGKFIKRLFKDCKEFKDVQSAYNGVYQEYIANTLPWNEAYRVLPAKEYVNFVNKLTELVNKAKQKLDKFEQNMEEHIERDLTNAGGMLKREDYPSREELGESFYVKWHVSSIPSSDDFRVVEGLEESEIEDLVNKAIETEKQTMMNPVKESWNRLFKVVSHMKERLSEYQGADGERLHKSLVTNVQDCVSVLRKLNITNDSNLESVLDELEDSVLSSADIDRMKILKTERDKTVSEVDKILSKMSMFSAQKE